MGSTHVHTNRWADCSHGDGKCCSTCHLDQVTVSLVRGPAEGREIEIEVRVPDGWELKAALPQLVWVAMIDGEVQPLPARPGAEANALLNRVGDGRRSGRSGWISYELVPEPGALAEPVAYRWTGPKLT